MEEPMKKSKLPKTKSIRKLAEFWDSHDLTHFEDELEEVREPVFVRGTAVKVQLESREARQVDQLAKAKGVTREELIRAWVRQRLRHQSNGKRAKTSGPSSTRR
jgi:chromatin segregation and condensation protein Rec8/ScpA/Scc1 (kleisin family)